MRLAIQILTVALLSGAAVIPWTFTQNAGRILLGMQQKDLSRFDPSTSAGRGPWDFENQRDILISSDDIVRVQTELRARGFKPGIDGRLDAKTQEALQEFQKTSHLPATGVLDRKTARRLGVNLATGETPAS